VSVQYAASVWGTMVNLLFWVMVRDRMSLKPFRSAETDAKMLQSDRPPKIIVGEVAV